ncbi:uncharacterized protein [Panulirus ornatus]|uniref:uncharacterized protein n=1 Tax=Panulirus ornatus TaxID=150431 RepID=UPI003A84AE6C
MGGFMDLSMAAMLDDTTRSTTDLTEAPTEALTTTAPAEERTEGAPTVALDYDYPNITEDDSFKGYDYYEHLVDSLTAQDSPYKDEEEGQRKTSGTEPHETDAAPDAELTNLEFSAVDSLATMVSTKNSAREDLDEGNQDPVMTGEQVTGDSEGATTTEGPSTEEPDSTTSTPATDGYADEATATPDVDGDATTAFSVPLVVLRNQEMLNDLLNTQGVSGASKVVIREQGSKVAINHPAHQKHDPQLHDTTAGASSHVDASAAAPSGTSAVVQDDTLQTNATNPEVAEVGSPAGAVQTPDTRDQDETPAMSSSAENQDTTTITTPTTSSSAENQDTTTIDDDLTDLRQHLGAFQTTAATAADDVTDEGVDETTTSSVATDGTTQNPELATILIPYSFVQYLGHASGGSQGQDAPRDPVAQEEHLQSQHRGEDTPGDGDQERPAYGEGSSVDGEDSHYGDGRPVTDGEVSLNYGEGSSAYSEKGPLQDGEPGLDHGEGSSVYGAEKPLYSEGVRPVRGETQPVYGDGVALDGEASPGDGDSPIDGEISLANSGVNPSYGEDSTAHVETRLGYGDEESIVYDALYPVNREKESVHSASRPTNGEDSLAYGDASLAYGDASPDHSEPRPQQEGPVRGEGAQSHDGQESLVYGDRLAYGEESLAYGDQRPSYGEDSVYGDEARPAYGEGSVYGDDAEPAYGEGGVAYGEVARPVYGDGSVYGDGARPMYGEESAGRPLYDVDGNPTYGGVERVSYGGGGSPAYGSDGGSVSGGPVGGGISRKDDAGLTDYGGESPFFIKLPGSPNAVPVYLEYEPVQVKYVSSERTDEYAHNASSPGGVAGVGDEDVGLQEREDEGGSVEDVAAPSGTSPHGGAPDAAQVESEVRENATQEEHSSPPSGNDSLSATLMNGIYRILDNVAVAVNNQFSEEAGGPKQQDEANFIPHKPFGERPDPFFLMEAPQLGEHNSHQPPPQPPPLDANHTDGGATDDGKEESYSVDVSGKLGFDGGEGAPGTKESVGTVEDVPIGLKQEILYPGDYYSHHAYTGVNLSSLINPVFDLSTKPTTESHEDRMNPQYTPFPITTNPPRRMTPRPVHALLGPQRTRGQESGSSPVEMPKPVASTETPVTKGLASVEYSPIPAADFHDSYDASYIPGYFYEQENRIQPPTGDPAVGKDAFHGPRSPADEGVAVALDDTRRVSAAPYKITDDAALTLASLTSATLTAQDASGGTAPTAAQAAAAGEEEEEEATASGSNVPPPSDHFTAHQQVWSFPQSREEPGGQEDPVPYDPVPYDPVHHAPTTRTYTAFYSPREIPGIDPSIFGYRKVPQEGSSALVPTYDLPEAQEEEEVVPTAAGGGPNPGPAHQALLGPQFFKYLNSLPYALLRKFLDPSNATELDDADLGRAKRSSAGSRSGRQILCEWNVKTEPGLYLLMTFHNLSAPYTVDCHGAYIEVERENNGYDARWCGNRVYQAGTRPHVIFAKTEVRINVFDDGDITKSLPTGFESDIEVIDLFNADDYDAFMRSSAYPHIRRLLLG